MNHNIQSVSVWPGTATQLFIENGFSAVVGSVPTFQYSLRDAQGNTLNSALCDMTQQQWDNWTATPGDAVYVMNCIAANLGLTLV